MIDYNAYLGQPAFGAVLVTGVLGLIVLTVMDALRRHAVTAAFLADQRWICLLCYTAGFALCIFAFWAFCKGGYYDALFAFL